MIMWILSIIKVDETLTITLHVYNLAVLAMTVNDHNESMRSI